MRKAGALLMVALLTLPALAGEESKEQKRLEECGQVLKEILNIPDDIPKDLLDKAECVIVIPSVKKFALGVGGSFGRGPSRAAQASTSPAPGAHRPCLPSKVSISVSSWEGRLRILFCW